MLRNEMRIAERMPEQSTAALVEVLPVDEDHDARLRVVGEGCYLGIRHRYKKKLFHGLAGKAAR